VATSTGLFRADESGCTTAALVGRDVLVVTAAGGNVVAATRDLLFRSRSAAAGGTMDFAVLAGLTARPRAIGVAGNGTVFVAGDDGILALGAEGAPAVIVGRPADAIAVCGDSVVALTDDGVYASSARAADAVWVRAADRPPARVLACGPEASGFLAGGVGLWTSTDGRSWSEQAAFLGRSVSAIASVGGRTWVVADDELTLACDVATEPRWSPFAPTAVLAPPLRSLGAGYLAGLPWPTVTIAFELEEKKVWGASVEAGWSAFLLLSFPLDRVARHGLGGQSALAAELALRDAELARSEASDRRSSDPELIERARSSSAERQALR
jgi:hypothetical protein